MVKLTAGSRLKRTRLGLGLTLQDLAKATGASVSTIQRWESGETELSELACRGLGQVLNVRWEWLLRGEEPMRVSAAPRNALSIPLLDGLPSCGPSGEISDLGPGADEVVFSAAFVQELLRQCGAGSTATLFAARIQGDSMRPLLQPGDTILVNTALPVRLEPRKGALHLVRRAAGSSEARVKRVWFNGTSLTLRSEARDYPDVIVDIDGTPIQDLIIGQVCWYGRNLVGTPAPAPGDW